MKKIACKLPEDTEQAIAVLPFLHQIFSDFGEGSEIHLIGDPGKISFLSIIPFKVHYHEFPNELMKDIFSVHKGVANLHALFKVDIYFALTESPLDSFIGFNIRAKSRVGFKNGVNAWLLTNRVQMPLNAAPVDRYFRLLSANTNREYDDIPQVRSKDLEKQVEVGEYYLINLSLDSEGRIDERWLDFLGIFTDECVYIVCEHAQSPETLWLFQNKLRSEGKNNCTVFSYTRDWELAALMAHAKAVLSAYSFWGLIASYTGAKTVLICDELLAQNKHPHFLIGETLVLSKQDQSLVGATAIKDNDFGSIDFEILFDRFMAFVENRVLQLPL